MNITYLQLMQQTPKLQNTTNRSVKEEDINLLQNKIEKVFPLAYIEFLFLGGSNANMINVDHGFYNPNGGNKRYIELIQERVHKFLEKEKLEIEGGEYWVICELDGGEQFDFFYFNDPDAEDPENPPVYASYPAYVDEDEPLKKKIANSFSEYIEAKIKAYT